MNNPLARMAFGLTESFRFALISHRRSLIRALFYSSTSDLVKSKGAPQSLSVVAQFFQVVFVEPVVVAEFVEDRDTNLLTQFRLVDLTVFVGGQ